MRRFKINALLIIAVIFLAVIAFAQSPEEKKEPPMPEKMKDMPMDKGRMGGIMDMMKMMMQKQMVASADGGVIILVGNKLLKYDKNLNLVKEVELKFDMESMQNMMEKMKEKCGMQKEMMQGEGKDKESK